MYPQEEEERNFNHSSNTEWDREEARWIGEENKNCAWILTGNDVWHKNPYYHGPAVPHPFEDDDMENYDPSNDHQPYIPLDDIPF
jgi:hypothetical protein